MIRTFQTMMRIHPGFGNPTQVQTFAISIPEGQVKDPEKVSRMQNDMLEQIRRVPGVFVGRDDLGDSHRRAHQFRRSVRTRSHVQGRRASPDPPIRVHLAGDCTPPWARRSSPGATLPGRKFTAMRPGCSFLRALPRILAHTCPRASPADSRGHERSVARDRRCRGRRL